MINILCKYWQIKNAEEFGRTFRIPNPKPYFDGEKMLSHNMYTRVSNILAAANKMENERTSAFALQEYIDENNLMITDVAKMVGSNTDTVRRWLALDAMPNRNSVLRIAVIISSSPLEDEWLYQIAQFKHTNKELNVKLNMFHSLLGVSQPTLHSWVSGTHTPRKATMERLLPWLAEYNDKAVDLVRHVQNPPTGVEEESDWKPVPLVESKDVS